MRTDILKRLVALNLTPEAFNEVVSILAEAYSADDARRERERVRRSKYPRKGRSQDGPSDRSHRDQTVTVTGTVTGPSQDGPPSYSLKKESKKESKIPEAKASGGEGQTQAELERELFSRGRQVCGKSSGGLISSLLKSKQHDVALARSVIELAATKHDPREFVAAATRSKGNGNEFNATFDRLLAKAAGEEVEGNPPMRDVTPRRPESG